MSDVLPGAEPLSSAGTTGVGVLVIHGFTGNPSSMRTIAEAMAAAGHAVELPRLPGHGTTIEEMVPTRWDDWTGEVELAYQRLAFAAERVVVVGLSMGGALTLWTALRHPEVAGIVCINPATMSQPDDVIGMVEEMLSDGTEVMPAIGGDIADPDVVESAYDGTPLRALLSLVDAARELSGRYGELSMPALVITSRQDHVVPVEHSEHLVATYGGPVEHVWLDRSYHVATQDYDRDLIVELVGSFVARVT
jgi:carboxylesterase